MQCLFILTAESDAAESTSEEPRAGIDLYTLNPRRSRNLIRQLYIHETLQNQFGLETLLALSAAVLMLLSRQRARARAQPHKSGSRWDMGLGFREYL